jgi:hypothetical protein
MGLIIAIVVVVVLLLLTIGAVALNRRRKSKELQEAYGPEYDRAVEERGDRKEAEKALEQRRARREELDVRPLSPESRDRYSRSWLDVQRRFVDEPEAATGEADDLVKQVMHERGYPVDDFESRADDLSVDHPHVVENYRSAHAISERNREGQASTEELRQATVHYRSLFDELLDDGHGDDGGRSGGDDRGGRGGAGGDDRGRDRPRSNEDERGRPHDRA